MKIYYSIDDLNVELYAINYPWRATLMYKQTIWSCLSTDMLGCVLLTRKLTEAFKDGGVMIVRVNKLTGTCLHHIMFGNGRAVSVEAKTARVFQKTLHWINGFTPTPETAVYSEL